jgi:ATP-binding cassette subfamily B protein
VDDLVAIAAKGLSWQNIHPILPPGGLMAGSLLLTECLRSLMEWVRTAQSELLHDRISALVHQKSVSVDLALYESSDYYDRFNRARSHANSSCLGLLENSGYLLRDSLTLLAMSALLLTYGVWLPVLLVLSALPVFAAVVQLNQRQHLWWKKTTTQRRWIQYYELLLTHIMAAQEVRLFNLGSYFQDAYQSLRHQLRSEQINLAFGQSYVRFLASSGALVALGVCLVWMLRLFLVGTITLGDLALFYQAFNKGQAIINSLLANLGSILNNGMLLADLFDFLQIESKVIDIPSPLVTPIKVEHGFHYRQVTFRYPGSEQNILTNFDLFIPAGKIVAIVGDNGAGKTTLIKLLCRFYDPDAGSIELDGRDIRQFSVTHYRQLITVLFQQPVPYYLTASQNIQLGDLTAPPQDVDVQVAAQAAGIDQTIRRLPQGYNTPLGKWFPGGSDLSGGEWQRLALARAFYRQAQLIILDEPTSAMDPWAEQDWLERFRALAKERTALVITHRFTLARSADLIHIMREGKIVESGTHEELLDHQGLYAQSWQAQL